MPRGRRKRTSVKSAANGPGKKPKLLQSTQDILNCIDADDSQPVFTMQDLKEEAGDSEIIEITSEEDSDFQLEMTTFKLRESNSPPKTTCESVAKDVGSPALCLHQPIITQTNALSPTSQPSTSTLVRIDEVVLPLIGDIGNQQRHEDDPDDKEDLDYIEEEDQEQMGAKKTGRKKHSIWTEYITKRDRKEKIISNQCRYCKMEISSRTPRMQKHTDKCKAKKRANVTVRSKDLPASSGSFPRFQSTTSIKAAMERWTIKENVEFAEKMDKKIGRFFFGCNVAFRKVESPYFVDMMKTKHEKYDPPSAYRLKTTILDSVYNDCIGTLKESLNGKKLTIVQDGWSTNQNEPVISHCLHAGTNPVFFDAVATETNKKTGQYCFEMLQSAMVKAETLFSCKIIGVVTDNCSTMKTLQSLVKEIHPELFVYGCHAHIFNLLGQDFSKEKVTEDVVSVNKFFRNHHFEGAALKKLKGKRPVIPVNTRWNSQLDALRSYKDNHTKYLEISRMDESKLKKESNLKSIIEDVKIYAEVCSLLDVLTPIAISLDKVQKDDCTIADAFSHWKHISDVLPKDPVSEKKFKARMDMACPPVAVAAYMLHPTYRGRNITREEQDAGLDFLDSKNTMLVALAASLKSSDTNMFPRQFLKAEMVDCMSSSGWWKGMEAYSTIGKSTIDFCESLMLLPASSAAIERSFSTLGDILSKKRNQLALERARKLCLIYRTLAVEENEEEESDHESE